MMKNFAIAVCIALLFVGNGTFTMAIAIDETAVSA